LNQLVQPTVHGIRNVDRNRAHLDDIDTWSLVVLFFLFFIQKLFQFFFQPQNFFKNSSKKKLKNFFYFFHFLNNNHPTYPTMASITINLNDSLNNGLNKLLIQVCKDTVLSCSKKYGFSHADAIDFLGINNSKKNSYVKREKSDIPLPFTGIIRSDCCIGLKNNHGLYTQCTKNPTQSDYCNTCFNQTTKNASGKPNLGNVHDRMHAFLNSIEYKDPKGNSPTPFAKVIAKLNISRESVVAYAKSIDISLDEQHFVLPDVKRGRPKKNTDKDNNNNEDKKPRGRPKKSTDKTLESSTTEDLFATLIAQASKSNNKEPEQPLQQQPEEPAVSVKRFEFNGKKYLKSQDNILYDPVTQDCVGVFNIATNSIDPINDEEDEDEDNDE
jgi:hypothetical protein